MREAELTDATGRVMAVVREGVRFAGHKEHIGHIAFAPDAARLATCSMDRTVRIWDSRTGDPLHIFRHDRTVDSVSFSPDGDHVASTCLRGVVRVWNGHSGEPLVVRDHNPRLFGVRYSPDGQRLALTCEDSTVHLCDSRTGETLLVLHGHEQGVVEVNYSPDGSRLASASNDKTARVWDSRTGASLLVLRHPERVHHVCYLADGRRLITLAGGTLRIWDSHIGAELLTVRDPTDVITDVCPSPCGTQLAYAWRNGSVHVRDAATGHHLGAFPGLCPVAWSPDGASIVTRSRESRANTLQRWDITRLAEAREDPRFRLAVLQARTVGRDASAVGPPPPPRREWVPRLADASGAHLGVLRHPTRAEQAGASGLAFANDGSTLYTGDADGHVHAWDLESGARRWTSQKRHKRSVTDLSLAPNGENLVSQSADMSTFVWHPWDGTAQLLVGGPFLSVSHSPDSTRLASAMRDGTIRVWSSHNGDTIQVLHGHAGPVNHVSHSPDGTRLASASNDRTVHVWDSPGGDMLLVLHGHEDSVDHVSHSPDGARLASASSDRTVRIWDSRGGPALLVLRGHADAVTCVAYSPNGACLASASTDGTIAVWSAATGDRLHAWTHPAEKPAWRVAWAPSGAFLAASYFDGTVQLWDARPFMFGAADVPASTSVASPPPPPRELQRLPGLAAILLRHRGHAPPLALLRDVQRLLLPHPVAADGPAHALVDHPRLLALRALRWPPDALAALTLLLCADADDPSFAAPSGITPTDLESVLTHALATGEPCPDAPPSPKCWTAVRVALDHLDLPPLLSLLHALGPAACAARPHTLLALTHLLPAVVPLSAPARRLLAAATPLDRREGPTLGPLGLVPAGVRPTGPPWTVRPWQWALSADAFAARKAQNRLSHTDREGSEPPRLRPTVLVLDDSIEAAPVEQILRASALVLATSLVQAGTPLYLLTAAAAHTTALQHPTQLAEILAPTHRAPVDPVHVLEHARDLARSFPAAADPPTIVLLTHVYFAADVPLLSLPPELRAMCVHYPRHAFTPAWVARCRRHVTLGSADLHRVPDALADLLR